MRNTCLGAQPGQTNQHLIWAIISSQGWGIADPAARVSSPWPCGKSRGSETLTLLWGPVRDAPSQALYSSTACKSMKWKKGAGCKADINPSIPTNLLAHLGQDNWPRNLQTGKGGPRYGSRLDLTATPQRQRGCVSPHPG